jgi:hypothetical protein
MVTLKKATQTAVEISIEGRRGDGIGGGVR